MIRPLIEKTAWPMTPPAPWSAFHIIFSLLGIAWAVVITRLLCRSLTSRAPAEKPFFMEPPIRVLWFCGLILGISEIYKQLFLYKVVNNGRYDWWYFPFQLCSTPMYLCLAIPFLPSEKARRTAAAYVQSFGFLGGIMALAEPSGLMHPYWTLTLHGLVWHVLLIFGALFSTASGLAGRGLRDFLPALPLFFLFCLMATIINILTEGQADMFYISPYYPITQVVFHDISMAWGIWPGIALYLLSVCAGAFLCRRLLEYAYGFYGRKAE
ncbi:MAG: YwaF family protein [Hungatella sp.]|jgi:hypothetical protein|nr:YwaF family protein [Hungatella sp.]